MRSSRRRPVTAAARPDGSRLLVPLAFLVLISALALGGCNTVSGFGEDVSAAGSALDRTSERTQDKMTGKETAKQPANRSGYEAGPY